jgi:hypothetical protein
LVCGGHTGGLLVLGYFDGGVFALVAAMAYDVWDGAHKGDSEALFARARLQASRPRALCGCAVEDSLGTRPPLGTSDIYAGAVEKGGGGGSGSFLLLLLLLGGAVSRGLEEGAEVIVVGVVGRLVLCVVGCGELVGLVEDLGLPAALGEELAGGLVGFHHGAASRPDSGWSWGW